MRSECNPHHGDNTQAKRMPENRDSPGRHDSGSPLWFRYPSRGKAFRAEHSEPSAGTFCTLPPLRSFRLDAYSRNSRAVLFSGMNLASHNIGYRPRNEHRSRRASWALAPRRRVCAARISCNRLRTASDGDNPFEPGRNDHAGQRQNRSARTGPHDGQAAGFLQWCSRGRRTRGILRTILWSRPGSRQGVETIHRRDDGSRPARRRKRPLRSRGLFPVGSPG